MIWKYNDKLIDAWASAFPHATLFIHTREPEEIQRYVDYYDAITLCIRRPSVENNEQSNHADANVYNYDYECYIDNDGTLEELKEKVKDFCDTFLKGE